MRLSFSSHHNPGKYTSVKDNINSEISCLHTGNIWHSVSGQLMLIEFYKILF